MPPRPDRTEEIARRRAAYFADIDHLRPQLDFLAAIRDVLPDDGIFVEDVTQIGFAAHLAFDFRQPRTFQSTGPAGTLGAGYAQGVGAQVALEREGRGRKALVVAGDGGFLFTGNELATAVQHEIPLVCCLFDDGAFGNVKRIQQQRFGARPHDRLVAAQPRLRRLCPGVRRARSARRHAGRAPRAPRRGVRRRRAGDRPRLDRADARSVAVLPAVAGRMSEPCTITALDCGWLRTQQRTLIGGGTTDLIEIPVPAWLVRHGDDVVVFDAGLHPSLAGSSEPLGRMSKLFQPMLPEDGSVGPPARAARRRSATARSRSSSRTRHFDHVGGLCEMPNARIVVNADEWAFAMAAGQEGGFDTTLVDLGHDVKTVAASTTCSATARSRASPRPATRAGTSRCGSSPPTVR